MLRLFVADARREVGREVEIEVERERWLIYTECSEVGIGLNKRE